MTVEEILETPMAAILETEELFEGAPLVASGNCDPSLQLELEGVATEWMLELLVKVAEAEVEGKLLPAAMDWYHPPECLPAMCQILCERLERMRLVAIHLADPQTRLHRKSAGAGIG